MSVALVLGGYVNGYCIIRELAECGVKDIWLFRFGKSSAARSNRIIGHTMIENTAESLRENIVKLRNKFDYIVIYPTDDFQLELLHAIYDEISSFCFIPINQRNLLSTLSKGHQYEVCDLHGIPCPKSKILGKENDSSDLSDIVHFTYPLLIKPIKKYGSETGVFRSLYIHDKDELARNRDLLTSHMDNGLSFLVSECIPGDDTNIYSYAAHRSKKGKILNEWIGKKLNQYPNDFGNFSSATNAAPEVVREQGRKLLAHLDVMGFGQPEFKFDARDGQYKLMEVNLRSMMWNRMGALTGVHLQFTQWCDAMGIEPPIEKQNLTERIHFIYMKHEILNVLTRMGYLKHFLYNCTQGDRREFAFFDRDDPGPFIQDFLDMPKALAVNILVIHILRRSSFRDS